MTETKRVITDPSSEYKLKRTNGNKIKIHLDTAFLLIVFISLLITKERDIFGRGGEVTQKIHYRS